jgi:hypothetical protein
MKQQPVRRGECGQHRPVFVGCIDGLPTDSRFKIMLHKHRFDVCHLATLVLS